jgi:hypothetical protein
LALIALAQLGSGKCQPMKAPTNNNKIVSNILHSL